jgi:hypothetical protein
VAPVFAVNALILAGGGWLNRERPATPMNADERR